MPRDDDSASSAVDTAAKASGSSAVCGSATIITSGACAFSAIDVGRRRVGLAISDPTGTLARPLTTLTVDRRRRRRPRSRTRLHGSQRRTTGCRRSSSGCRRGSTARRASRPLHVAAFIAALQARTPIPIVDRGRAADEPRSREPAGRHASATGASARRQLDAAAAAVILQDYLDRRRRRSDEDSFVRMLVALAGRAARWRGAAAFVALRASTSRTAAITGDEQFVDIPPGLEHARDRRAAGRRRRRPRRRSRIALALWLSGEARRLQAGEYRFDHPMTPLDVIDKIARGDVYLVAITFPEGLTIAEMAADLRGARAWDRRRRSSRRPHDAGARARRSIPARAISKAICFPRPTPCRAAPTPRSWSALMVERFEQVLTPDTAPGGRGRAG